MSLRTEAHCIRKIKKQVEASRHKDFENYNLIQYVFYYDWRLDPLETADELNAYIKDVKAATGYDKVGIICRCLGANVFLAYVAKYGMQCASISKANKLVGDQLISAKLSSFGATTSTIFEPLSDEYIAKAVTEGKGKYISPDRQIDASTCMFPDQTFFIKGASHSDWTKPEMELLCEAICADRQLTIDDLPQKHFMVYSYEASSAETMNEENCHSENWTVSKGENSKNPFVKIADFFKSLSALIKLLFNK